MTHRLHRPTLFALAAILALAAAMLGTPRPAQAAESISVTHLTTMDTRVLADVTNTGADNVTSITIVLSASISYLPSYPRATLTVHPIAQILAPGERSPLDAGMDAAYDTVSVVSATATFSAQPPDRNFKVVPTVDLAGANGWHYYYGQVTNLNSNTVDPPRMYITDYGADGGIVDGGTAYADGVPMPPGATSQWERDRRADAPAFSSQAVFIESDTPSAGNYVAPPKPVPQTYPGGGYTSVVPYRVLDTRSDSRIGSFSTLGIGQTISFPVAGTGGAGGVPAGATAVVLNVTAVGTLASGYLTVFPAGGTRPLASNVNFFQDVTGAVNMPNLVEVALGDAGGVSIYNSYGYNDLVVDVEGYVGAGGDGYFPLTPTRIEDTRTDGRTLHSGGTLTIPMPASVPSGASAVVVNVTATNQTMKGYLTVYPTGSPRPLASNLNWTNVTMSNRVQVRLGAGSITLYNYTGDTDVVVDLNGYFLPGAGASFTGVTPTRIEDTRTDAKTMGPGATMALQVSGFQGAVVPATATAVVLNVTSVGVGNGGYLTVSPGASGHPLASDLNYGWKAPNLVVVAVSNGTINFYNGSPGITDVVVDLEGWYG